jgi:hypothetical protein
MGTRRARVRPSVYNIRRPSVASGASARGWIRGHRWLRYPGMFIRRRADLLADDRSLASSASNTALAVLA